MSQRPIPVILPGDMTDSHSTRTRHRFLGLARRTADLRNRHQGKFEVGKLRPETKIDTQLLRDNPELAKTMKANDLGKLGGVKRTRRSSASRDDPSVGETSMTGRTTAGAKRDKTVGEEDDDEPWLKRINKKAKATKLITLSDEE